MRTLAAAMALALATSAPAQVLVKLGTLAPEGSSWHDLLLEMKQEWKRLSNGEVDLRLYAGGVLGDEGEMVRKMQRRGLDAVALSGAGLGRVHPSFDCLNIPLAFASHEELDAVRDAVSPRLERDVEAAGFKVLNWSDAGWVYFFTKTPVRTPDDLRRLKLWTSSGDPASEALYKDLGLKVVPLPATDMLTSLQTGLIEAVDVPPLFALLDRSYQQAPHMLDLRFAALPAATVISASAWNRIPEALRPKLLAAARAAGLKYQQEIRRSGEEAIAAMKERGLDVVTLDAAGVAAWEREACDAYPKLRARLASPELFDEVLRLRDEYRRRACGTPAP